MSHTKSIEEREKLQFTELNFHRV